MMLIVAALAIGATAPAAEASGPAKRDKQVCKSQQKTGTRFPTKICRTAAQWEEATEQTKREAGEMINRSPMTQSSD